LTETALLIDAALADTLVDMKRIETEKAGEDSGGTIRRALLW
jgi:hypothetical protein